MTFSASSDLLKQYFKWFISFSFFTVLNSFKWLGNILFDWLISLPVFRHYFPRLRQQNAIQGRDWNCAWPHITGISPLRGSLRAAPFRTGVPTLVLSSQDRSAMICFLDGRTRSPPSMPHSCRYLHRWIFALPPVSLPILYLYKAHQRMYFSFWIFTLQGAFKGCFLVPEKFPSLLIRTAVAV